MAAVSHCTPRSLCDQLKRVCTPVTIAVALFGMSTWIAIVGIWVEMPFLVTAVPESWNLPSYLAIIIQFGNIGPLLYTALYAICVKIRQRNQQTRNEHQQHQQHQHSCIDAEVLLSLIIILTDIASMLLLSLFWDQTAVIASANRSVALLILVFFAALSCCTSSVVFLPYMARFPSVYMSAYYFGQALCRFLLGILGLPQGAEVEPQCRNETHVSDTVTTNILNVTAVNIVYYSSPRFSVSAFFVLVIILLCVSAAAFCCLNFVQKCRNEMTASVTNEQQSVATIEEIPRENIDNSDRDVGLIQRGSHDTEAATMASAPGGQKLENETEASAAREGTGLLANRENTDSDRPTVQNDNVVNATAADVRPRCRYICLLVNIFIINALWNGVHQATQTYTCLPYGNIAYRLAVHLSCLVCMPATILNMLAPTSSLSLITGLGTAASMIAAFHLLLAAQSPNPILQDSVIGQIIVVATSVIKVFCFAFVEVSASSLLHREGGRSLLLYCGGVTQLGSFCGALISFILIVYLEAFQRSSPCAN